MLDLQLLHSCLSDQQVKLHIDVNSFGTGNLFRCAEGELRTMRMNRP